VSDSRPRETCPTCAALVVACYMTRHDRLHDPVIQAARLARRSANAKAKYERSKDRRREYLAAHRDRINELQRARYDPAKRYAAYLARQEKAREEGRSWRDANREKYRTLSREGQRARYWSDVEKYREKNRRYYATREAANRLNLGNESVRINSLPPEMQEVARLLKQARHAIRSAREGNTP
jgi:hypothetical protein